MTSTVRELIVSLLLATALGGGIAFADQRLPAATTFALTALAVALVAVGLGFRAQNRAPIWRSAWIVFGAIVISGALALWMMSVSNSVDQPPVSPPIPILVISLVALGLAWAAVALILSLAAKAISSRS
jgi:hypothetical protein